MNDRLINAIIARVDNIEQTNLKHCKDIADAHNKILELSGLLASQAEQIRAQAAQIVQLFAALNKQSLH